MPLYQQVTRVCDFRAAMKTSQIPILLSVATLPDKQAEDGASVPDRFLSMTWVSFDCKQRRLIEAASKPFHPNSS
jgi:hypothetical protein